VEPKVPTKSHSDSFRTFLDTVRPAPSNEGLILLHAREIVRFLGEHGPQRQSDVAPPGLTAAQVQVAVEWLAANGFARLAGQGPSRSVELTTEGQLLR
jgi:hypothetical protein